MPDRPARDCSAHAIAGRVIGLAAAVIARPLFVPRGSEASATPRRPDAAYKEAAARLARSLGFGVELAKLWHQALSV
jgi:hypothetical protein